MPLKQFNRRFVPRFVPPMRRNLCVSFQSLLVAATFVVGMAAAPCMAAATIETYVDQAVPSGTDTGMGQPLSAGDLTLKDILKVPQKKKKPASLDLPAPITPAEVSTPQLKPAPRDSAAGAMLLEGMQSVLRQSGVNTASPLKAPRLPNAQAPATVPAAQAVTLTPPAVVPPVLPTAPQQPVIAAQPVAPQPAATTSACVPQTSAWVKSCADAGYPQSYVGEIRGETRTTCPEGNLQDVWISNGCAPPEEPKAATNGNAPLTSPTSTAVVSSTAEREDGSCGASNGLAANARPLYDLCAVGTPSSVSGDGPWRWNCQGVNGGIAVSCAAPVAAAASTSSNSSQSQPATAPTLEDGQCGAADNVVAEAAPTASLCAKGTASHVNGSGPWTWACSGSNGGRAAACSAPKKIDGACGAASGLGTEHMPSTDLCTAGYASAVTGNGPWNWTCSGLNGGAAATCSATTKANAVCGPASLNGRHDAPKNGLCSVGEASAVSGSGPWHWACSGLNGGASVSCSAAASVNGICGSAHGTSVVEAPSENLCASGRTSRVNGTGPWSWACSGTDGGDTASCVAVRAAARAPVAPPPQATAVAPVPHPPAAVVTTQETPAATAPLCGTAAEAIAIEEPSSNLCKTGSASRVSGRGPWTWTCNGDKGSETACSTLSPIASSEPEAAPVPPPPPTPVEPTPSAACGSASGISVTQEPNVELCAIGKASAVKTINGGWAWTCAKDKTRANCEAPKLVEGACGSANGAVQRAAPSKGLCNSGSATAVQGKGPWAWTCVGAGGGSSVSCSAMSQAQVRVDGSCGVAANTSVSTAPSVNLCDSGTTSAVYGEGPWTWTCSGLNGGAAASCSASKNTPPAPPPPGPAVNGLCGSANGAAMAVKPLDNLCSTGTATSVSGEGPWNWNCLGENSGLTVSCTAPLQPPAPISGACGAASGVPTLTKPKSGLCSAGITSAVSGQGPWTWSCSGVSGGSAVGCVAPFAGGDRSSSLPSLTTRTDDAPVPEAAPSTAVSKKGLVTPRLPNSPSPPPPAPATSSFAPTPEAPALPEDSEGVPTPPVRDTILPSPALRSDDSGNILPGNHFVLPSEVSTIAFAHGSDNFDSAAAGTLNNLADVLAKNSNVRITLTAYADNAGTTPREARRVSLSRALAIRDYLTSKGISSARIDVRALGANVSTGDKDRVDVKAN